MYNVHFIVVRAHDTPFLNINNLRVICQIRLGLYLAINKVSRVLLLGGGGGFFY